MDVSTSEVARLLRLMADLAEIRAESVFRVRAFARAARVIHDLDRPVEEMGTGELQALPGIGARIAGMVTEMVETGTTGELEEMRASVPPGLPGLLDLEGVGPQTVRSLWQHLGVTDIFDLETAARGHRIRALSGFGPKKERMILRAIERQRQSQDRMTRPEAESVIELVMEAFSPGGTRVAGSFRRGAGTVGDIDVVTTDGPDEANRRLSGIADEVISRGRRRTSIRCRGRRVDVRYTEPALAGSMLLYLTGSKEFNISLRRRALAAGYRLNEYGLSGREGEALETFSTEEALFTRLGMDAIPPELRENRGEVAAAAEHRLPDLVETGDLRGDLHTHTRWSDGHDDLPAMLAAAEERGYEYLLISDHASHLGVTRSLDETRVRSQAQAIERANRESECRALAGVEVDIDANGSATLPSRVLADLDLVIGAVHTGLTQEMDTITRRIIGAIEDEHIDIIAHPTGRLLGTRRPSDVDLGRIIEAAAENRTALEINASPLRLDLDDPAVYRAREKGVLLSLGTDAHRAALMDHMRYGVLVARRGWCEPADLLNTLSCTDLLEWASS
ncbi:MAG: DNA polymerase/3'-5' exonuclease PolX [Methanomicrobiales archaeon]